MIKRIGLFLLLPIFAAGLWGCASDGDADNPVDNNPYEPIELEAEEFDTHEYLKSVRERKNEMYQACYAEYEEKYSIAPRGKKSKKK